MHAQPQGFGYYGGTSTQVPVTLNAVTLVAPAAFIQGAPGSRWLPARVRVRPGRTAGKGSPPLVL